MQPIKLCELGLKTHHTGRVLYVWSFTESIRLLSVQVGVEGKAGDPEAGVRRNEEAARVFECESLGQQIVS